MIYMLILTNPVNPVAQWRVHKVAPIIYLSSAKESFLHNPAKHFAVVRRDLVAMLQRSRGNGELLVRVPDHEIGIVPNGNRSFSCLHRHLSRWITTQPL